MVRLTRVVALAAPLAVLAAGCGKTEPAPASQQPAAAVNPPAPAAAPTAAAPRATAPEAQPSASATIARPPATDRPAGALPTPTSPSTAAPPASSTPAATEPQSSSAPLAKRPQPTGKVRLPAKLGAVTLDHKKHAEAMAVPCARCHHASHPEKPLVAEQQACSECHTTPATAPLKTNLQGAFHDPKAATGTCLDCHREALAKGKPAPVKCMECHKKG